MKKILFSCLMLAACLCVQAQTTTQILDRAAAVVGRSGGCSAAFTLSHPQTGKATGNIQIKGQKFHAVLGEMEVWFNGKTQCVYQASTEEVSISNPSAVGRQQMNPYTFISLYKRGYNAKHVSRAGYYIVTLTPQKNTKPTLGVITLTIRKKDCVPTEIRFHQNGQPVTIRINSLQAKNQPDGLFQFNPKKYPNAEIIDLR